VTAAYWVWRRELAVMLRAPVVYVVGGLFLAVQGFAFAGLVGVLSDPLRPAPLGALLEGQLSGTLLTWVLALVVLTLLGMRAIAEDKRSGSWESLLTAGVGEGAAVAGKWLAAATVYAVVWLPTAAYLGLVALYRADTGGWDVPAIAVGYAGAIALGAALLAWPVAASAAMSSPLAAGALGFAWLIVLLLVGELGALWPDLATDHATLARLLDAVSLRAIAADFARGHVALRALAVLGGLAVVGLSLAVTLACAGRRHRRELAIRALGTLALAVIAVLACVLIARHPAGLDLSAAGRSTLSEATRETLAELPGPAAITIVQPTLGAAEPIYDEVARIAGELADAAPGLIVRRVDPASAPGGLTEIARAAGLSVPDLASGGSIVIELGGQRRVLDLAAFAAIDLGPGGAQTVEQFAVEQAIAGALAALAAPRPLTICATTGHGELAMTAQPAGQDWAAVGDRLRGEGMAVESVELVGGVPARCTALVVAGPRSPLPPEDALAIQDFVRRGGGLIVAAGAAVEAPAGVALPATGLEGVLAADGLGLAPAIAVEPRPSIPGLPGTLKVFSGYADHPINRGFAGVRTTLWVQPRVVITTGAARPLISAAPDSWGERNLFDPPARDADDVAGPVALAAIGGSHRVIAIGSAGSLTTAELSRGRSAGPLSAAELSHGVSAADLWLVRAIRFVTGTPEPVAPVASRAPDQVRLVMTDRQRLRVIVLSVAGLPLAWLVVGGAIVWWRRRAAR
jgi:ABC-2 type transport system permease protein